MRDSSTVFVGMDYDKDKIAVATLRGSQETATTFEILNEPKAVRRAMERLKTQGQVHAFYEAGPCGFEPYRFLTSQGVRCEVIAPALIPRRAGDRVKTNRRDAIKLARLGRAGELTSIRVPTAEEEAARDLVRAREDLRRDILASRHRLSKFLLRHDRVYRQGKAWTEKYWQWLRSQRFDLPTLQATLDHYIIVLQSRLDQRTAVDAQLRTLAESGPWAADVARLRCLRGLDTLSALTVVAEIQDFRRFSHAAEFMSFLGLTPSEYSTGDSQNRGRITKTGNAYVRRVLVEAAWSYRHRPRVSAELANRQKGQDAFVIATAWRAQMRLYRRYCRFVAKGRPHQVAIVAMARELAGFVWASLVKAVA